MRPAEWVRLTNRLVENAKPSSVDEFLRAQQLKGFGVRVRPSGVKTFFLEYRSPVDGRFRRLKVGRYPELSVEAARMQAKQAKGRALWPERPGRGAFAARHVAANEMTLEALCEKFISEYAEKHRRSWKRDKARFHLAGDIYRELWKKRISEVIPADLVALHNKRTRRMFRSLQVGQSRQSEPRGIGPATCRIMPSGFQGKQRKDDVGHRYGAED